MPFVSKDANAALLNEFNLVLFKAATTELVKAPALVELKPANAVVLKAANPCVSSPAISSVDKAFNTVLFRPETAAELKLVIPAVLMSPLISAAVRAFIFAAVNPATASDARLMMPLEFRRNTLMVFNEFICELLRFETCPLVIVDIFARLSPAIAVVLNPAMPFVSKDANAALVKALS